DGRLTVFGFDENRRYGFDPAYRGRSVTPKKALEVAGIDPTAKYLPLNVKEDLQSGDPARCHFTMVRGTGFRHALRWRKRDTFDDLLQSDSQAKQVLDRARVIFVSDTDSIDPLKPIQIAD